MALIETPEIAVGVHNTIWQQRLKRLGLTQKEFARLTGWAENTISRQMREEWPMPLYVRVLILALCEMKGDQLTAWRAEADREAKRKL